MGFSRGHWPAMVVGVVDDGGVKRYRLVLPGER